MFEARPSGPDSSLLFRLAPWIVGAFAAAMVCGFLTLDSISPANRRLIKIRGEDPVAYFGTAHSILFDRDFDLRNEFQHVPPDGRWWTADQPATGLPGSPWGLGYSFLEMPLLALGSGIDGLTGHTADGYGAWAIAAYCVGTVLMVGLGLLALFFLLREMAAECGIENQTSQAGYALLLTFVVFFGTNVGYYSFSQMAHSSTFLFATLFLLIWRRIRDSGDNRSWLLLGLTGGMLSICRWQDVLQLGIPLLYDLGSAKLRDEFSRKWRSRLFYAAGVGVWWIPQVFQWKAIYGKYLTIPQSGYFSFPPEHVLQVLLSTQSGWVTWTPAIGLGLIGLVIGVFRAPRFYAPFLIVLALEVLVVGSISFWDGINSFGARYLLSLTPIAAVGMITLWGTSPGWMRTGLTCAAAACCIFVMLFAVEFGLYLIPTNTPLTFSEYVTDRLHPGRLRIRKAAVREASDLLEKGEAAQAARALEAVTGYGEDRDVERLLAKAYGAAGRTQEEHEAEARLKRFLQSTLY